MQPVISITRLKEAIDGEWVALDKWGTPLEVAIPEDRGPATLMVSEVTDALKTIDEADRLGEAVDRSTTWAVDAIILNTTVLDRLGDRTLTAEQLIEAVAEVGFAWQVSSTSAP